MTPRFRRILLAFVGVAALAAGIRAAVHTKRPAGDFLRYDRAGALVWTGRADLLYDETSLGEGVVWGDPEGYPEQRYRYSPGLAVLMAPFGALDPDLAWALWSALCAGLVVAAVGLASALAARVLPEGVPRWLPAAAAAVPLIHLYTENVKLGQMNCLAFGLSVGALYALDRGRDRGAGLLAAGATVAKHIPVLLLLYFAWKRRWKAAAWTLGAGVALLYLLPTAVLGPQRHHRLLGEWTSQEDALVTEIGEDPGVSIRHGGKSAEGQSVKPLLARYLTRTPFMHLVPPKLMMENPDDHRILYVNGGREWDPAVVFRLWLAAIGALLVAVVFATQPLEGEDRERARLRFPLEGAMLLAALLLVSPESRNPHFQMLALAYASLAAWFAARHHRSGIGDTVLLGIALVGTLGVLLPTQGLVGRRNADILLAHGVIGFGTLLLFGVLTVVLLRERAAAAASLAPAPPPEP